MRALRLAFSAKRFVNLYIVMVIILPGIVWGANYIYVFSQDSEIIHLIVSFLAGSKIQVNFVNTLLLFTGGLIFLSLWIRDISPGRNWLHLVSGFLFLIYLAIAYQIIQRPNFYWIDRPSLLVIYLLGAFLLVFPLAASMLSNPWFRRFLVVLCMAGVLFLLVLSQMAQANLVTLLLNISAFALGFQIVRLLGLHKGLNRLELVVICAGTGWSLLGVTAFILAALGWWYQPIVYILIIITITSLITQLQYLRGFFLRPLPVISDLSAIDKLVLGFSMFLCLFILIGALTPEIQFDPAYSHLGIASRLAQEHRFGLWPESMPILITFQSSFIYAYGVLLGGPLAGKLQSYVFFIGIGLALISFCYRYINFRAAIWALVLWCSANLIQWGAATGYVDVMGAFFLYMAFYILTIWCDPNTSTRWLIPFGFVLGTSLSIKFAAGFAGVPIMGIMSYYLFRKNSSAKDWFTTAISLAIPFAFIFLPWLIRDMIVLKNPVFPLFNDYFKSPHASGSLDTFSAMLVNRFGVGRDIVKLVQLPYLLAFDPSRFAEFGKAGLSFLIIPFLVVFWNGRRRLLIHLLIILVTGGAMWLYFAGQYSRWLTLFWPFWAILGGGAISGFAEKPISSVTIRRLTLILLSSLLIVSFIVDVVSETGPMFGYSFKLINGSQSIEEYLQSYVWEYNVIEYLNKHYNDYKAVSLAPVPSRIYQDNWIISESLSISPAITDVFGHMREERDPRKLYNYLKNRKFTHILVNLQTDCSRHEVIFSSEFLSKYAFVEFASRGWVLIKLRDSQEDLVCRTQVEDPQTIPADLENGTVVQGQNQIELPASQDTLSFLGLSYDANTQEQLILQMQYLDEDHQIIPGYYLRACISTQNGKTFHIIPDYVPVGAEAVLLDFNPSTPVTVTVSSYEALAFYSCKKP